MTIDWDRVREDFFAENLRSNRQRPYTLRELAMKWALPYKTVRNRSSAEGWREELQRRASAHRMVLAGELQKADIANELELRRRQVEIARRAQEFALARLRTLAPETLSPREAIELLRLGLTEERRAAGIPERYEPGDRRGSDEFLSVEARKQQHQRLHLLAVTLTRVLDEDRTQEVVVEEADPPLDSGN